MIDTGFKSIYTIDRFNSITNFILIDKKKLMNGFGIWNIIIVLFEYLTPNGCFSSTLACDCNFPFRFFFVFVI